MKLGISLSKIIVIFVFSIGCSFANAGGMEGGGGKSVVCRDSHGRISKVELLDLFEGRVQYQLKYHESSVPWKQQALNILSTSGLQNYKDGIIDWYHNTIAHLVIVSNDVILKPTSDSFEVIAPKGCNIEQVANYQNDRTILIAEEIWEAFSETQKAALMIHESTYRYLRGYKETNSRRARHFTAFIVAGNKIAYPNYDNKLAYCYGGDDDTSFTISSFIDNSGKEKNRLSFTSSIAERHLLSETFADVDSVQSGGFPLIDFLKSPPNGAVMNLSIETNSLFEPGDRARLVISSFENGDPKVVLSGTSAVDEGSFSVNIQCQFPIK